MRGRGALGVALAALAGVWLLGGGPAAAASQREPAHQSTSGPSAPGALLTRERLGSRGLAYRSPSGKVLKRIRLRGLVPRHGGVALSPDGSKIAFYAFRRYRSGSPPPDGLYLVDARGGRVRTLVAPSAAIVRAIDTPVWSRDGTRIAVSRAPFGVSVVDLRAGPARVIPVPSRGLQWLEFTPDSAALLATVRTEHPRIANADQLVRVPLDGGPATPLLGVLGESQQPVDPVIAPDGRRVAFFTYGRSATPGRPREGAKLWVGALGAGAAVIAVGRPDEDPGLVSWSPDGRRLAVRWNYSVPFTGRPNTSFVRGRGEVISADGRARRRLAVGPAGSTDRLSWSPDSRYIAYDALEGTGMAVAAADGSRVYRRPYRGADSPLWAKRRPGRAPLGPRIRVCITAKGGAELLIRKRRRGSRRVRRIPRTRVCGPFRRTRSPAAPAPPSVARKPRRTPRARGASPGPGICTTPGQRLADGTLESRRGYCAAEAVTITVVTDRGRVVGVGELSVGELDNLHVRRRGADFDGTNWNRLTYLGGVGAMTSAHIKYRIKCRTTGPRSDDCIDGGDRTRSERLNATETVSESRTLEVSNHDFRGGRLMGADTYLEIDAQDGARSARPTGWVTVITGPRLRCDKRPAGTGTNTGCVYPEFTPTFAVGRRDPLTAQSVDFLARAQQALAARSAPNGIPPRALVRQTTRTRDRNRDAARRRCRAQQPQRPAGVDCDEFPFASARRVGDPFEAQYLNAAHNEKVGSRLAGFYGDQRILEQDPFYVRVDP